MIRTLVLILLGILLLGVVFKLVKLAIIIVLIVGGVVLVQRYLADQNDRPRLP